VQAPRLSNLEESLSDVVPWKSTRSMGSLCTKDQRDLALARVVRGDLAPLELDFEVVVLADHDRVPSVLLIAVKASMVLVTVTPSLMFGRSVNGRLLSRFKHSACCDCRYLLGFQSPCSVQASLVRDYLDWSIRPK
jgi:hypothetical protein